MQVYLKLQCRCLVFSETYPSASDGGGDVERGEGERAGGEGKEEDGSDCDDVWAAMETVGEDTWSGMVVK